jgi:hypothetical protein
MIMEYMVCTTPTSSSPPTPSENLLLPQVQSLLPFKIQEKDTIPPPPNHEMHQQKTTAENK